MTGVEKVHLQRAYVLHQRAYKNSSQLLDCLTEDHGIVSLVAQGSRRAGRGQRRALLQPFHPLQLSWSRRGELGRLTDVELAEPLAPLVGNALFAGYYANELMLRLVARGDANRAAYSCYIRCLAALAASPTVSCALRMFERDLLQALGYGIDLEVDIDSGEPIRPELRYRFEMESGARLHSGTTHAGSIFLGQELIALRDGELGDIKSLRAARRLLQPVLAHYLGDRPLKSSLVMRALSGRGLD
jgi:DNA repair protein RecO (recombination protein O)